MNGDFEEKYFCAANSGTGFVSFYPQLIEKAARVFVIKGGPGTGKSRFMREAGTRAEKLGKKTVYYYCSSDPISLDAVMIDNRFLILDGTAPHAVDASVPGARDDLINLGAFWDPARLIGQRKRIAALSAAKSACFERAYDYLSAAAAAVRAAGTLTHSAVLPVKLHAAAERSLRSLPDGNGFRVSKIALGSYGMRGYLRFDTFRECAGEYITVSDYCLTAHLFFAALLDIAVRRGLEVTVSVDPLIPERLDGIRFESSGKVFELGTGGDRNVNMKRFVDPYLIKPCRASLRQAYSVRDAAAEGALSAFRDAAEYHFGLEKIYGGTMDFAAKEEFTDNFIGEMFD